MNYNILSISVLLWFFLNLNLKIILKLVLKCNVENIYMIGYSS